MNLSSSLYPSTFLLGQAASRVTAPALPPTKDAPDGGGQSQCPTSLAVPEGGIAGNAVSTPMLAAAGGGPDDSYGLHHLLNLLPASLALSRPWKWGGGNTDTRPDPITKSL